MNYEWVYVGDLVMIEKHCGDYAIGEIIMITDDAYYMDWEGEELRFPKEEVKDIKRAGA